MNNTDTPTPRTDAELSKRGQVDEYFARQLERELDAANAKLAENEQYLASRVIIGLGGGVFAAVDKPVHERLVMDGQQINALKQRTEAAEARVAALEKELADEKARKAYEYSKDPEMVFTEEMGWLHVHVRDDVLALQAELAATREHCRVLGDALAYYADEAHWDDEIEATEGGEHECKVYTPNKTTFHGDPQARDGWEIAKAALATTPEQIGAELTELREDKADLDWLNASDARGVNTLAHETADRRGHVFDKCVLPQFGEMTCAHFYGPTVRAAIRAARKEATP